MSGFKCDQCKTTDGLDEMGLKVWVVNWDHPIPLVARQLKYSISKPNLEQNLFPDKNRNIGKMIDELGRVKLLHRRCHTLTNK